MIGNFKDIAEASKNRFAESALGKQLDKISELDIEEDIDKPFDKFELAEISKIYDDNGKLYIIDDELQSNTTYELNESIYTTDQYSRIVLCESTPQHIPENPRDNEAQREVGGNDRRLNDQGGHIVGRDLNGDGGRGNLIAMDSNINQSDYKRMENNIKNDLDEGKKVSTKTEISYTGESRRPDKIKVTVLSDGKETVYEFDNNIDGKFDNEVTEQSLSAKDFINTHPDAHVSSIKRDYDENGEPEKITAYITYTDYDKTYRKPFIITND